MSEYLENYPTKQIKKHSHTTGANKNATGVNSCKECLYSQELCNRIKRTCEGHLKWADEAELVQVKRQTKTVKWFNQDNRRVDRQSNTKEAMFSCFGENYWVTGKLIKGENEAETQPLAPMHFQLLKFANAATMWQRNTSITKCLPYNSWIGETNYRNQQGFCAFATRLPKVGEDSKYRLEGHVWMWRLLKSAEELGLANTVHHSSSTKRRPVRLEAEEAVQVDELSYPSVRFRRQVLRRFTTENPVSGQRMLAIRRSASQNRFEFRERDTVLFYDRNSAFFTGSEALWKATTDAQQFHVENQDARWDDPLRYTLALLMGETKKLQINSMSAADISAVARSVLYQSSSANGLLPGRLNSETKEAEIFQIGELRDYYWHVTFEVPFALWTVSQATLSPESGDDHARARKQMGATTLTEKFHHGNKNMEMKRSMPFNSLIDQDSIVEFSDEWLYPRPSFLDWRPPLLTSDSNRPDTNWSRGAHTNNFTNPNKPDEMRGIVVDIPKTKSNTTVDNQILIIDNPRTDYTHISDDAMTLEELIAFRAKIIEDKKKKQLPADNYEMYRMLEGKRAAEEAKKRLIWSCNANDDTALLCYLVSPESDQARLSSFFTKHKRREKFFFDDTTATANLWVTEFHLSSWQIFSEKEYTAMEKEETDLNFLGGGKRIRRACMGFHFVGDFFDRYWTCHVFQYEPKNDVKKKVKATGEKESEYSRMMESFEKLIDRKNIFGSVRDKQPWHQRKVLELLLFHRMLENIARRYTQLLTAINQYLDDLEKAKTRKGMEDSESLEHLLLEASTDSSSDAPLEILSASNKLFSSSLDYGTYPIYKGKMPAFQYSLQVMEEDLQDTFEKIDLWNARERDRKPERPRWTKNDESRYRFVITKVSAANDHKIRELQRYLSNIQSLRVSLTARLDSARDDLAFQSAENVRFFTYVTVVFLPMGFATALFSMNVAPAGKLVGEMVAAAFAALMVTLIALGYAGQIDQNIIDPISKKLRPRPRRSGTVDHTATTTSSSTNPSGGEDTSRLWKRIWPWNCSKGQHGAIEGENASPSSLEEGRKK
jgi:Mg2+ and Co2+ transporter CorA